MVAASDLGEEMTSQNDPNVIHLQLRELDFQSKDNDDDEEESSLGDYISESFEAEDEEGSSSCDTEEEMRRLGFLNNSETKPIEFESLHLGDTLAKLQTLNQDITSEMDLNAQVVQQNSLYNSTVGNLSPVDVDNDLENNPADLGPVSTQGTDISGGSEIPPESPEPTSPTSPELILKTSASATKPWAVIRSLSLPTTSQISKQTTYTSSLDSSPLREVPEVPLKPETPNIPTSSIRSRSSAESISSAKPYMYYSRPYREIAQEAEERARSRSASSYRNFALRTSDSQKIQSLRRSREREHGSSGGYFGKRKSSITFSDTSRKKRSAMESSYQKYYRKLSDKSKKSNEFFEKTKFYREQHWDFHQEMKEKDKIIQQKNYEHRRYAN